MFQNNKLLALLIVGIVWVAGMLAYPGVVKATCWTIASSSSPVSCDGRGGCTDSCTTYSSTDSEGTAWYSCGEYCWHTSPTTGLCDSWGQGCYMHVYGCDTSCGASTPPSCFVPGTIVGNSSGGKKIEDVKVGDSVTSFEDEKLVESVVSRIYKVTRDFYYKLVAGDYEVRVTAEHPFYIGNDKFEEVQNLKVGDDVYVNENKSMIKKTITSLERINEPTDAYNMTVDNTNTYFADGFAVHNKGSGITWLTHACSSPSKVNWYDSTNSCLNWNQYKYDTSVYANAAENVGACTCEDGTSSCHQTNWKLAQCCAANEEVSCLSTGTTYTATASCHTPTVGCSLGDTYVSGVQTSAAGLCYVAENNCVEQKNGDIDCEYTNIYNYTITCARNDCGCHNSCDDTAPTAITATDITSTTATISWTPGANGTSQLIRVDEDQTEVEQGCPTVGDCEAAATLDVSDTSETVSGLLPNTMYYARIVTFSDSACYAADLISFTTLNNQITGKVYLDENNSCSTSTPMSGQTVIMDGVTGVQSGADGSFVFDGASTATSHGLAITIPSGYVCSTGTACANGCTKSGVISPSSNSEFFLTQNRDAWWQAEGATIYAGGSSGVTIGSTIPSSAAALDRYLIVEGALGSLSSGAILRNSATAASLGQGGASVPGYKARTIYRGKRTDYNFFKAEMGLSSTYVNDWTTESGIQKSRCNDPGQIMCSGPSVATNVVWRAQATDAKPVVFVNGDLNIEHNVFVDPDGFVAFVVKGNIIVDPTVTTLEGLYVTDGDFITESNGATDVQLQVNGNVVAWGDIILGRDLVANNSNSPAEVFMYRPDLLISMPEEMKSFVMQWSEVVPGTYDEQ